MSEIRGKNKDWITKNLNKKQDLLVPGKNIKTINGESILGEGNLIIGPSLKVLDLKEETAQLVKNPNESIEITDSEKVALINEIEGLCATQTASVPYILQSAWGVSHIQANAVITSDLGEYLEIYCPIIKQSKISNYETTFSKFIFEKGSEKWTLSVKYLRNVEYEEAGNYVLWFDINDTTPVSLTEEQKRVIELILKQDEDRVKKSLLVYLRYNLTTFYSSSNVTVLALQNKMYIDFFSAINENNISPIRLTISPIVGSSGIDLSNATATLSYIDYFQEKLVSGTNIKTINGENLLGSGNLDINGSAPTVLDLVAESIQILSGSVESVEITDTTKVALIKEIMGANIQEDPTQYTVPNKNYIIKYLYGFATIQSVMDLDIGGNFLLYLYAPILFVDLESQTEIAQNGRFVLKPDDEKNPTKVTLSIEKVREEALILNMRVSDDGTSLKPITEEQKQIVRQIALNLINDNNTNGIIAYLNLGLFKYTSTNIIYSPLTNKMYIDFLAIAFSNDNPDISASISIQIDNIVYSNGNVDTNNISWESQLIKSTEQAQTVVEVKFSTTDLSTLLGTGELNKTLTTEQQSQITNSTLPIALLCKDNAGTNIFNAYVNIGKNQNEYLGVIPYRYNSSEKLLVKWISFEYKPSTNTLKIIVINQNMPVYKFNLSTSGGTLTSTEQGYIQEILSLYNDNLPFEIIVMNNVMSYINYFITIKTNEIVLTSGVNANKTVEQFTINRTNYAYTYIGIIIESGTNINFDIDDNGDLIVNYK